MTVDVEARLHAASGSLRLASERLPHQELPRSRTRLLAVAAVVLVVAALAAGLVLLRPDGSEQIVVDTLPAPRLIPADYPEELPPPLGFVLPLGSPALGADTASITVFGDPAAGGDGDGDDLFAAADLAVAEAEGDVASYLTPYQGDPVTVRGDAGEVWDDPRLGTAVTWEEAPGRTFVVASRTLGPDDLLTVAEGLTLDGGGVALGSTPAPLAPVGEIPDVPLLALFMGMAPTAGMSAEGYMVGNETDDYELGLFVTTVAGDASDVAVLRWLVQAAAPVEVRGHDGWIGTAEVEGRTGRTLIWEESPGVVAVVQATGYEQAQVVAFADGLRPIEDDEWAQMFTDYPTRDGTGDLTEEAASGEGVAVHYGHYRAGTWSVFAEASGQVCGEILPDASDLEPIDVCASQGTMVAALYDTDGVPVVLFGELPDGAVAVGSPDSGDAPDADVVRDAGGGRLIYALPVQGALPPSLVFYDEEDRPVTTVEVDA